MAMFSDQLELAVTPVSNTGSGSPVSGFGLSHSSGSASSPRDVFRGITRHVDAITLLWETVDGSVDEVNNLLVGFLGVRFLWAAPFSMNLAAQAWERCYRSECGSLLQFQRQPSKTVARLALCSGSLSKNSPLMLMHFLGASSALLDRFRASRIDIAVDDYSEALQLCDLCEAVDAGDIWGFRTARLIKGLGCSRGWTLYCGSRQAEAMVRIYDKRVESKGRIEAVRFEQEYKGSKAESLLAEALKQATAEEMLEYILGAWRGNVDFASKGNIKNRCRAARPGWWQEFLDRVKGSTCVMPAIRVAPTVVRAAGWIQRQVSKSLLAISMAVETVQFDRYLAKIMESVSPRGRAEAVAMANEYLWEYDIQ